MDTVTLTMEGMATPMMGAMDTRTTEEHTDIVIEGERERVL